MDAVAVEVVLVSPSECADADRARAALSDALLAARAPAHGGSRLRGSRATGSPSDGAEGRASAHWTVSMSVAPALTHVSPRLLGSKSVEAVIIDDAGTVVAQRTLTDRSARMCTPLARAVGAWASLVLDAQMMRAKDDDGTRPLANTSDRTGASTPLSAGGASGARQWPVLVSGDGGDRAERDRASSFDSPSPATSRARAIEVGGTAYIRNGLMAIGGVAGISPFVAIELTDAWVVRPSLMFGRSTQGSPTVSQVGGRADICRRIPGNYVDRRGIEADMCGGAEVSVVTLQSGPSGGGDTRPRVGLGPSATLRGELGAGIALEVRGAIGANLAQAPLRGESGIPLVFAAAELGLSVRLR